MRQCEHLYIHQAGSAQLPYRIIFGIILDNDFGQEIREMENVCFRHSRES